MALTLKDKCSLFLYNDFKFVQRYYFKARFLVSQLMDVAAITSEWPSSKTKFLLPARWHGEQTVPRVT